MTSNETKRDVFEVALDDWKQNFISSLPRDGSFEDWSESLSDYSARYATALPDDLPVIPKAVGEILRSAHGQTNLLGVLDTAKNGYKVSETLAWIIANQNTFARAWVLGVWRVEETGEVFKL